MQPYLGRVQVDKHGTYIHQKKIMKTIIHKESSNGHPI